ncbi:hypothetical protein LSAT2_010559 [Lamellibrachia satsuma]|nr:hypothetical protein LSAT2_010559 [Lamellibrachia satsuma]
MLCLIVASCSVPSGRHPSATRTFLRMRRSTSDLFKISRDIQHRMNDTFSANCQQVQTDLLPLSSKNGGPLDVCRTIANYMLPMLSMPPLTVFKSNRPVAKRRQSQERQLYCDLSAQVIPRLRNLIQLLHAKIPDAKDLNPTGIDLDIDSSSPHSALRLYDVAVLEYARRQMVLITTLFLTI